MPKCLTCCALFKPGESSNSTAVNGHLLTLDFSAMVARNMYNVRRLHDGDDDDDEKGSFLDTWMHIPRTFFNEISTSICERVGIYTNLKILESIHTYIAFSFLHDFIVGDILILKMNLW